MGTTLNGAFTIWVRRDLAVSPTGEFSDNTDNTALVVTAEGIAPYTRRRPTPSPAPTRRAGSSRSAYSLLVNQGNRCQGLSGQEGLGPSGENFDPCSPLTAPAWAARFGERGLTEKAGVQ